MVSARATLHTVSHLASRQQDSGRRNDGSGIIHMDPMPLSTPPYQQLVVKRLSQQTRLTHHLV